MADWFALIISGVATIVAFFAFKASRAANETTAMQVYFEAYRRFHDIERDYQIALAEDSSNSESEKWKIKYRYALMEYYNAVDYVCAKYLFDRISQKSFAENMKDEIKRLWTSDNSLDRLRVYGLTRNRWANIGKAYLRMGLDTMSKNVNQVFNDAVWH